MVTEEVEEMRPGKEGIESNSVVHTHSSIAVDSIYVYVYGNNINGIKMKNKCTVE